MDLTTKERVKVHGEAGGQKWGTSSDDQLDAIIAGYSADFERMLDRIVLAAAQTETFDVDRGQRVFSLKAYPVTAVTSIINDTERLFTGDALATTEYSLNLATGLLQVDQAYLLPGPGVLQVIYTGGMALTTAAFITAFPALAFAMDLQVLHHYQRRNSLGATSLSAGQGNVSFQGPLKLLPTVLATIKAHRRISIG